MTDEREGTRKAECPGSLSVNHRHSVVSSSPAHAQPTRVEPERTWEDCMKGVVFVGDRKLELREFPDPTPGPRDVVLEIKASGMCGSDLHVYRAPFKPGDASSGFKRGAEPAMQRRRHFETPAARLPRGRGLRTCPWARLVIRVFGVRLHSPVGDARGDQQEAGTSARRHGRGRQTAA